METQNQKTWVLMPFGPFYIQRRSLNQNKTEESMLLMERRMRLRGGGGFRPSTVDYSDNNVQYQHYQNQGSTTKDNNSQYLPNDNYGYDPNRQYLQTPDDTQGYSEYADSYSQAPAYAYNTTYVQPGKYYTQVGPQAYQPYSPTLADLQRYLGTLQSQLDKERFKNAYSDPRTSTFYQKTSLSETDTTASDVESVDGEVQELGGEEQDMEGYFQENDTEFEYNVQNTQGEVQGVGEEEQNTERYFQKNDTEFKYNVQNTQGEVQGVGGEEQDMEGDFQENETEFEYNAQNTQGEVQEVEGNTLVVTDYPESEYYQGSTNGSVDSYEGEAWTMESEYEDEDYQPGDGDRADTEDNADFSESTSELSYDSECESNYGGDANPDANEFYDYWNVGEGGGYYHNVVRDNVNEGHVDQL